MLSQEKAVPLHTLYKTCKAIGDPLAQLVEHNTFNVGVLGSSPKRITNQTPEILDLWIFGSFSYYYTIQISRFPPNFVFLQYHTQYLTAIPKLK